MFEQFDITPLLSDTPEAAGRWLYIWKSIPKKLPPIDLQNVPGTVLSYIIMADFLHDVPAIRTSTTAWWYILLSMADVLCDASEDYWCRLTQHMKQELDSFSLLAPVPTSTHQSHQFIVIDNEWVMWTGSPRLLRLADWHEESRLFYPGVEHVAYNLTEVSRRFWVKLLTHLGVVDDQISTHETSSAGSLD